MKQTKSFGQILFEAIYRILDDPSNYHWNNLHSEAKETYENAAQELLSAQWRSVDDPPEDDQERVILGGGSCVPSEFYFGGRNSDRTHWMRTPKLPKPKELTLKEKEQKLFEENYLKIINDSHDLSKDPRGDYYEYSLNQNFKIWCAAKGLKFD